MNDANEVERLRARVAELETQLAGAPARPAPRPGSRQSRWWAVSSAVLLVLACVLAPVSVASVWANAVISDTNRYVETVAPLAKDPAVQNAVANEVTTAIFDNLDVQALTTDALNTLAAQPRVPPRVAQALPGLAVPITNGVESFTRTQVNNLVRSPRFAVAWTNVNRIAHAQVVKLLEGNQGGAVSAQGNTITLNLGPVIAQVKQRLVARGFTLASKIPVINKSFVLVQSNAVTKAQRIYGLLNTLGVWLPFVVLGLFVGGVALARDRRRAMLKGALGVTGAMLVLGVGLVLVRMWYVDTTPGNILTPAAAGSVFDTLVRFLRTGLRALAVLGLVVALGAFLAGPSTAAVRTRSFLQHGIGSARGSAEAAGWNTGRFGAWVYAHKRALMVITLVAGALVLVFWNQPTGWVVVGTALVALVVLAIIEFLGRPPVPATEAPEAGPVPSAAPPTLPRQVPRAPAEEEAAPHATSGQGSETH
jgi:hypothetical protein